MATRSRLLTLDSNVFIAALKGDEPYSQRCREILGKVPEAFILAEPGIIYQEVCGTLARRAGLDIAAKAETHLDMAIHPRLLASCDRAFCGSSYPLCAHYGIYAIDAMFLKVALDSGAVLASLDRKDFIDRVRAKRPDLEAYHVSEFPY